ncbi:tyrosine-type recombinase/integrase [Cobetia marina]|uniref:tyrosine-type recombinase/integrase n=2 Tax=Cobetia TaxID=204286 RepID=UPI001F10698B|nr:site-specific integrase [Cobetia marina]
MVADVMLKTPRSIIKVLNKDQLKSFMKSISNITHKLIVRLALTTGMRREELATFPLKYVIDPTFYSSYRSFIRVDLKPQDMAIKGEHPRSIDIPRSVMEDLWQYSLNYRYQLEKKSGESHPTLFLTEYGKPYANQGAALLGIVKKAARSAGINYMNVHMLRHTYATHTLYAMKKTSEVSLALLYVRDRLGHASVTTTEKYLHCLSDAEDILMNDYQKEIDYISME